ncbi:MAG: hypothetical protein ACTSVI_07585 [Promethearchaeota archaeon]
MVMIFGKVRWAFLIQFVTTISISVLLVLASINALSSGYYIEFIIATIIFTALSVGAFFGGIVAHRPKFGILASTIFILVVYGVMGTLLVLNITGVIHPFFSGSYHVDYFLVSLQILLPPLAAYGVMCFFSAIGGVFSKKFIVLQPKRKRGKKEKKSILSMFNTPLFILIFIITWIPLLVPLFTPSQNTIKKFSAWNINSSGTSRFREELENAGYTNIKSCITSYSILSRINEPFVLIVLGPNKFYNPVSDVPFMIKFLKSNGSMLIAHEQGSTSWLMYDMFTSSLTLTGTGTTPFPIMLFADGILRDNYSYYNKNNFPVITSSTIFSHEITQGVNKLVLDNAGGLLLIPDLFTNFGWNVIATSTPSYSWVDKKENGFPNGNGKFDSDVDKYGIPFGFSGFLAKQGISLPDAIPMGGFPIPAIATTEYGVSSNPSRIVVTTDASMFSNELIDLPGYDNKQFALNCMEWLTRGNKSMPIVFDEAHLKLEGAQDVSPAAIYGQILDYVGYMSSNWFIAPFYPFLALNSIRKWLPKTEQEKLKEAEKKRKKEEKKLKKKQKKEKRKRKVMGKIQFGGKLKKGEKKRITGILKKSTYFMQKLTWYIEQSEYNQALGLLYNRVKRLIGKRLGDEYLDNPEGVIHAILEKNPNADHKFLHTFFDRMARITTKGTKRLRITSQESFEKIYFEMITVQELLGRI